MEKISIPMGCSDEEEIRLRFKLICKRCGSEDIAINIGESWGGSDVTGGSPGSIQIGCNGCKQNDFYASI